jgi:cation diffusion facilitator family transporter
VNHAHDLARNRLTRYAALSISAALATLALKFAAFGLTNAIGLLSDAIESLVNLLAAAMTFLMLRLAAQPPDDEHSFGHDKAEFFSSGFEGALIVVAAAGIAYAAVERATSLDLITVQPLGLALTAVSSLTNFVVARVLAAAGNRTGSIALQADAQHLMTDVWTSLGLLAGIGVIALSGWVWIDIAISLVFASHIALQGVRLIRRSALGLLDTALPAQERAQLVAILDRFRTEQATYHALRTRQSGSRRFVTVHILVPGTWTVRRGHALLERIERTIRETLPNTIVGTHLEPSDAPESFDDVILDRR